MIGVDVRTVDRTKLVVESKDKAAFRSFVHGAASVRKAARKLIERSADASQPGQPIHTRRGQVPNAIVFDATKKDALIGPRYSRVGDAAAAHEFGGEFRGSDYPERPFMEPALQFNVDRFAEEWEGSVGR